MNTLLEKNTRLNLLGPPLKKLQHLTPVPVLVLALIGWFIPGFWETGLFTLFAVTVLCLAGVVREIMRLRILKQRLSAELYQQTVLKVGRASMIGYFVPIILFYSGYDFPRIFRCFFRPDSVLGVCDYSIRLSIKHDSETTGSCFRDDAGSRTVPEKRLIR